MTDPQTLQKIAAFKQDLIARGETLADYCRKHALDYEAALAVVKGRAKGRHGKVHQVYVALGLKRAPSKTHA